MLTHVLVAVDNETLRGRICSVAKQQDVLVDMVKSEQDLWEQVRHETYDLLIVARTLLSNPAIDTVASLRSLPDAPEVVVLCQREGADERGELLAAGCMSVLSARMTNKTLSKIFLTILERRREVVKDSLVPVPAGIHPQLSDFVSSSPSMQAFIDVVRRVASSDTSLLITGETGVGKEWLARAIHGGSPRSTGPFVAVNCGALPESLLESELFGHEEGAFTGASRARRGWFELAHRGTIFLDEIGDMPHYLQVKLLHVLQSHEVRRIGAEGCITVDVRVMAATNADLTREMETNRFRRDLYYRLGVVTLELPPLRERREDIPLLVDSYINHFRLQIRHEIEGIAENALEALMQYSWPGNVRELINVIERAVLLCDGEEILLRDLPEIISGLFPAPRVVATSPNFREGQVVSKEWLEKPLREARQELTKSFERAYLIGLLEATGGKVGETARRAGILPRSLFEKMKHHGLRKEDFRPKRKGS